MQEDIAGAPTKAQPTVKQEPLTPLFAPTQRSTEPVTTGIDMGEGAGASSLMMESKFSSRKLSDILAEMIPFDNTGEIAILYQDALSRGN